MALPEYTTKGLAARIFPLLEITPLTFTGNSEFEVTETQTNNNGYTP